MKYLLLIALFFAISCKSTDNKTKANELVLENVTSVEFVVDGMTCSGCESTIQSNVSSLEGIALVEASHANGIATVKFDPSKIDTTAIKQKIIESGYSVTSSVLSE